MANRSTSAGVSMLVASLVDRYLCDNGYFKTQSIFRSEASFIYQPQVRNRFMHLDYILNDYIVLKKQQVKMRQEKVRLEQEKPLINAHYSFSSFAPPPMIPSLAPPPIPTAAYPTIPSAAPPLIPTAAHSTIPSAAHPTITSATLPTITSDAVPEISSAAIPVVSTADFPVISTTATPAIRVAGTSFQPNNFGVSHSGCNVQKTVNDMKSVSLPGNKRVDNFQAPDNDEHNSKKRKTHEVSSIGTPSLSTKDIKKIPRPKKRPINYITFDSPPKRQMPKDQVKGKNIDNTEVRKHLEAAPDIVDLVTPSNKRVDNFQDNAKKRKTHEVSSIGTPSLSTKDIKKIPRPKKRPINYLTFDSPPKRDMSKYYCVAKKDQVKEKLEFDNTEVRKNLEPAPDTVDLVPPSSSGSQPDDLDLLKDFGPEDMLEPSPFLLSNFHLTTDLGYLTPESTSPSGSKPIFDFSQLEIPDLDMATQNVDLDKLLDFDIPDLETDSGSSSPESTNGNSEPHK